MKRLAGVCFVAAYVVFFVLTANAQLTATITGTVSDSTGGRAAWSERHRVE